MNVQKLTQKSMEAVQLAQNIAEEHDNQQIEQCHVLLAMMMQDGGLVPQLLTKMGVTAESVTAAAKDLVSRLLGDKIRRTAWNSCSAPVLLPIYIEAWAL